MIIQLNTDHNSHFSAETREEYKSIISEALSRFRGDITRVEVHLSDENGNKNGQDDKRCLLEARFEGHQPIAATNHGNSYLQALDGALTTLKGNLGKIKEKMSSH